MFSDDVYPYMENVKKKKRLFLLYIARDTLWKWFQPASLQLASWRNFSSLVFKEASADILDGVV